VLIPPEQLHAVIELNERKSLQTIINVTKQAGLDSEGEKYKLEIKQGNSEFKEEGFLILRGGIIYVPNIENLHFKMTQGYHDHKLRGYPGVRKTREVIMHNVFWKGITKDIQDYVKACPVCQ
jgi:hypothetical protein